MTDDPRRQLLWLLETSGISASAFARAIGSDRTRVDDWLSGKIEIPQTMQRWLANAAPTDDFIVTRVGELEVQIRRDGPRRR